MNMPPPRMCSNMNVANQSTRAHALINPSHYKISVFNLLGGELVGDIMMVTPISRSSTMDTPCASPPVHGPLKSELLSKLPPLNSHHHHQLNVRCGCLLSVCALLLSYKQPCEHKIPPHPTLFLGIWRDAVILRWAPPCWTNIDIHCVHTVRNGMKRTRLTH